MEPRVEIAEGSCFEVLLGAAAVADADWREVFATGQATHARVLALAGPDFVRRVADLGRHGWINLVGLVTRSPHPWDLGQLIRAVRQSSAEDLHHIVVGGDRRQLVEAVEEDVIRAALAADDAARVRLTSALASDEHVLAATPWLLASPSVDVQTAVVSLLETWRERLLPPAEESELSATLHRHAVEAAARLAGSTGGDFLEQSIGGLSYHPAGLDRVIAVTSVAVAPVVVVVDGRLRTVILHPPVIRERPVVDGTDRLLALTRAVGDKTRLRLLTCLRAGELTAIDLAGELGTPRTTLLHHLAILRAAGLIHVTVTPGGATVYRLRPEAFGELSSSAAGFIPTG